MDIADELADILNSDNSVPLTAEDDKAKREDNNDLEDFLNTEITPIKTEASKSTSKNLEDELFELLNSSNHEGTSATETLVQSTTSTTATATFAQEMEDLFASPISSQPQPVIAVNDAPTIGDADDFLSWLTESPVKPKANEAPVQPPVIATTAEMESSLVPSQEMPSIDKYMADLDLDDVLGSEKVDESSTIDITPESFEIQLENILSSPFPDAGQLRQLIDGSGFLPTHLKTKIISVLLTGNCHVDEEAHNFTASEIDLQLYQELLVDIEFLSQSLNLQKKDAVERKIRDVIIQFCQRKGVAYKPAYSRILFSLVAQCEDVSVGLLSSCFHAIATEFLPLVGLQGTSLNLASGLIHFWLKLLLTYHSPKLAQHLDRVLPGWEKACTEITTSQVVKQINLEKGSRALDSLEQELGLDVTSTDDNTHSNSNTVLESAAPKSNNQNPGLIASSWISSFFGGCLPSEQASKVLSWAIFNGERFAGVYLVVTLLELYSESLLTMNGIAIKEWMQGIARNKEHWFELIKLNAPEEDNQADNLLKWSSFTTGWIHATSVLMNRTPHTFRDALSRTENWALNTSEKYNALPAHLSLDRRNHGDFAHDVDSDDGHDPKEGAKEKTLFSTATTILDRLLHLRQQSSDESSVEEEHNAANMVEYLQDTKLSETTTVSLWSDIAEVVPCICSNGRRNISDKTVSKIFYDTIYYETYQNLGYCFFISTLEKELPFYFAIDCRTEEEKSLGKFPKAFSVDPEILVDAEQISSILSVLESLGSSTHITIIGAGANYYRWYFNLSNPKKAAALKDDEAIELKQMIHEDENRTNAVALFFINKSFKYVSVLDGGFYAAAQFLHHSDSKFNLSSALVDIDLTKLHSMLGVQSHQTNAQEPMMGSVPTAAISGIKTVGTFISNLSTNVSKAVLSKSTTESESGSPVAVLVPVADHPLAFASETPSQPVTVTAATTQPQPAPAPAVASDPTAVATAPSSSSTESVSTTAKQFLSGWGKTVSMFGASSLESLKKGIDTVRTNAFTDKPSGSNEPTVIATNRPVDTQDLLLEDDDGLGPKPQWDENKIHLNRTDQERAQALALHKMAGLRKGDAITISRADLPGSKLFPSVKVKVVLQPAVEDIDLSNLNLDADGEQSGSAPVVASTTPGELVKKEIYLSRFLVVSRERLIVLDAHGGGVGSAAVVKSNHHLTELVKMTFRKKDPELVTLHVLAAETGNTKAKQYRLVQHKELVATLQQNMERFK